MEAAFWQLLLLYSHCVTVSQGDVMSQGDLIMQMSMTWWSIYDNGFQNREGL